MGAARDRASITGRLLPFGFVGPLQPADGNGIRIEELPQHRFEIPLGPRNTTKEIEAQRAVLRERVTGEV